MSVIEACDKPSPAIAVASANAALKAYLSPVYDEFSCLDIPDLSPEKGAKLIARIDNIILFSHAYAFHLNFRIGSFTIYDLLVFTRHNNLKGVKIHVDDGAERSLAAIGTEERKAFGKQAKEQGLELHVETSATDAAALEQLVEIALDINAVSVRCYPRNVGAVSAVMDQTITDLKHLFNLDPEGKLRFTLEQHEDLKSKELVEIIKKVNHPRLTALFDFGNSVNAYEAPEEALIGMGCYLTEVHAKDIYIIDDQEGWAHKACKTGQGQINIPKMLFHLLMLGEDKPQVQVIALEEEVDYYAPAFRFPNEADDPYIPYREVSDTPLPTENDKKARLIREVQDAQDQVSFYKRTLSEMRLLALTIANAK